MNLLTKQKETLRLREWTKGFQGKGWGDGIVREFEMDMYTPLYLKWITNNNLLYSTWSSAQCYVAAWMGAEFGGEWIHVYAWLGFPSGSAVKNLPAVQGTQESGFSHLIGKIPWRRAYQSMPLFLHVESHGWRSLAGYGPLGLQSRTQLKQLSMHACVCMAESLCCPSETIIPY